MSKISPMQAQALGIKSNSTTKPVAKKPATKPTTKPATATVAKPSPAKSVTKPAAKPASKSASRPAPKVVAKPIASTPSKAPMVKVPAPTPVVKATATKKPVKKVAKKEVKKNKPEKIKMERDSFTMPKDEYAQIMLMKARLTALGQPAKKSELLRAGIKLLAAMSDNTLKITLAKIPVIKTGRPNKKG
jgi:hypothetical protein